MQLLTRNIRRQYDVFMCSSTGHLFSPVFLIDTHMFEGLFNYQNLILKHGNLIVDY